MAQTASLTDLLIELMRTPFSDEVFRTEQIFGFIMANSPAKRPGLVAVMLRYAKIPDDSTLDENTGKPSFNEALFSETTGFVKRLLANECVPLFISDLFTTGASANDVARRILDQVEYLDKFGQFTQVAFLHYLLHSPQLPWMELDSVNIDYGVVSRRLEALGDNPELLSEILCRTNGRPLAEVADWLAGFVRDPENESIGANVVLRVLTNIACHYSGKGPVVVKIDDTTTARSVFNDLLETIIDRAQSGDVCGEPKNPQEEECG